MGEFLPFPRIGSIPVLCLVRAPCHIRGRVHVHVRLHMIGVFLRRHMVPGRMGLAPVGGWLVPLCGGWWCPWLLDSLLCEEGQLLLGGEKALP